MDWVLYKQGRLKDAINFWKRLTKVQIDESIIAEHLGDVYYRYQLTEKAKSMYIKAIQVEQDVTKVEKIRQKLVLLMNIYPIKNSISLLRWHQCQRESPKLEYQRFSMRRASLLDLAITCAIGLFELTKL